jgi:hypothetical protein
MSGKLPLVVGGWAMPRAKLSFSLKPGSRGSGWTAWPRIGQRDAGRHPDAILKLSRGFGTSWTIHNCRPSSGRRVLSPSTLSLSRLTEAGSPVVH